MVTYPTPEICPSMMKHPEISPDYLDNLERLLQEMSHLPIDIIMVRLVIALIYALRGRPTGKQLRIGFRLMEQIDRMQNVITHRRSRMAKYRSKIDQGWTFANVKLTQKQRTAFTEWSVSVLDDLAELITSVLLEGYKMSLKYDEKNTCHIVTLTGTDETADNNKTSMSARHETFELAAALVLYKHFEICQGGNWKSEVIDEVWG